MDIHEAYTKLGLKPLDTMVQLNTPEGRRTGATTWMLVSAALNIMEGGNVVIVAHDLPYARKLVGDCLARLHQLRHPDSEWSVARHRRTVHLANGLGWLRCESERTMAKDIMLGIDPATYTEFWDGKWRLKALDRAKGPFYRIRQIRREGVCFTAYDEDGEYLMGLTEDGALEMLEQDETQMRIETIGF